MTLLFARLVYPSVILLLAISFIALSSNQVLGRTWIVALDGSGDWESIQAAIDGALSTDSILVHAGTYYEDIDFKGKNVVLKSVMGPEATILNGSNEDSSVVSFLNGETNDAVIEGFSITGGKGTSYGPSYYGGALFCSNGSPTIVNNHIFDNSTAWGGAMVIGDFSLRAPFPSPRVLGNLFANNHASENGGAILILRSNSVITGNTFRGNTSDFDGGAVEVVLREGSLVLTNNAFWENIAGDKGGALEMFGGLFSDLFTVEQNLFVRNVAYGKDNPFGGSGGAICAVSAKGSLSHNTIVFNSSVGQFTCSAGGIKLYDVTSALEVSHNIIAFNDACGVACREGSTPSGSMNIVWQNTPHNVGTDPDQCPGNWLSGLLALNPEFCDIQNDVFTVATSSPALQYDEAIGAFPLSGCPGTPVHSTTWSAIKSRFR